MVVVVVVVVVIVLVVVVVVVELHVNTPCRYNPCRYPNNDKKLLLSEHPTNRSTQP